MAWVRRLDSGLWAATVRTPVGRITETDRLKGVVDKWAADQEANVARGEFIDPRLAETALEVIWTKHAGARRLEMASRKRDASIWRNHVQPRWGSAPVGTILKPDVQEWVNDMEEAKVGGWVIIAALNVLKAACELAVDGGYVRHNPARRVQPPVAPEHVDRVLTSKEELLLLARLDDLFPDRADARLFVEGLIETGGRWEEIAAVRREAVDLRHDLVHLGPVMERDGTIREYPKGARSRQSAGFRPVPISPGYAARLRPVVLATGAGGLVYTAPKGGPLDYTRWRARVWVPALHGPYDGPPPTRQPGQRGPVKAPLGPRLLADPQPTPHDLRHSYGTRLAEAGVPEHDRMELMGHRDQRSARRYIHSSDQRFDRARQALARARTVQDHESPMSQDLGRS
jgi:integrase